MSTERAQASSVCPTCRQPKRIEMDGVRTPPMPTIFWFCTNKECIDGERNKLFRGG